MFELLNAFGDNLHACMIEPAVNAMNPTAKRHKGFAHTVSEVLGGFDGSNGTGSHKPRGYIPGGGDSY